MKKFVIKTTVFALISGVFILIIEFVISTWSNDYTYKYDKLINHGEDIKYLMMGHSQAETSIIPSLLGDSVFNAAISGRNIYYDEVLLERVIEKMPNLKCVTFPLMYNFQYFPSDTTSFIETYRSILLFNNKYLHIPFKNTRSWDSWFAVVWSPKLLYKFKNISCDKDGYYATHRKGDKFIQDINVHIEGDSEDPIYVRCKKNSSESLKHIAQLCRDHNVRFIMYTIPMHPSLGFTQEGILQLHQWAQSAIDVYPQAEFYNYILDPRFVDDDFLNETHLQDCGARKFTKIIRREWFADSI